MNEISRRTLELILKSFESVSKDETRLYLNGVKLGRDENGDSIIESCDGHILARHFVIEELPEETIIVDKVGKARLKDFLNSNKNSVKFLVDYDVESNNTLNISTLDKRDGVVLPVIFRDYPKTNSIVSGATDKKNTVEISFNPTLLAKLYKSLDGEKRSPLLTLTVSLDNPKTSPIVVKSKNKENLGLLMPMRT
jgi:hypothetical protein